MKIDDRDVNEMSKDELAAAQRALDAAIKNYDDRRRKDVQSKLEAIAKEHGFSLNDFATTGKSRGKSTASIPKYAHPENPTLTWSGRGRQPDWFKQAIEAGKTREDMRL